MPLDLVFALDSSGSVKKSGFEQIKEFTKALVDGFEFGDRYTHVGVLTFSEKGEVQIGLSDTFDKQELFEKINNLKYTGYRTNTNGALDVIARDMFSTTGGARQGVSKVLILLTDGKCNLCGKQGVATSASRLKSEGVNIFAIGVTDYINEKELKEIASKPLFDHVLLVKHFDQLKRNIARLEQRSCPGICYLFVCLFVYLFIYLFVCLFIYLFVY